MMNIMPSFRRGESIPSPEFIALSHPHTGLWFGERLCWFDQFWGAGLL